jgi:predicted CXXCH cytochrome family protein
MVLAIAAVACGGDPPGSEDGAEETPAGSAWPEVRAYAGSAACRACHAQAYDAWSGSHHDRAMQRAQGSAVLAPFEGERFSHGGVTSRFFERDGRFFVTTEGPDGQSADFEIAYTFGVEPLQQVLIPLAGGRVQALGIAWDSRPAARGGQRWFPLYPDPEIRPGDGLHWTGLYQRWNTMCADCHSTGLESGYDLATDTYETTWAELNVGCEACHGPAGAHVDWARSFAAGDERSTDGAALRVKLPARVARDEVDLCAPCHSRRHRISGENAHGEPFHDHFAPEVLRADLYHADGQILDEVYVYGSFVQSKMYARGVRCSDCHEPHALELRAEGNALCVRCHAEAGDPRFPTLARKRYDTPEHHFHPPDSPGAACVACHMPAKVYMQIDLRRDHSLRVPRPDLSIALGTPNACNACHADRSAAWAADAIDRAAGAAPRAPHYGEVIAAGRARAPEARDSLVALTADPEAPAIVRATALDLLSQYGADVIDAVIAATRDADPLVRARAVAGLDRFPAEARLAAAVPRLRDPVRAVRVEAARVLVSAPRGTWDAATQRAFDDALAEFVQAQAAQADMPAAHLNLAVMHDANGRSGLAEQSYRTALKLDPDFLPARFNLAMLYNRTGRNADAERVLREALVRSPDEGELYYSLGLLLAEEQRLEEAADALERAAALLPARARPGYNYALVLQQLGRNADAEVALLAAHQIEPRDPSIVHALAVYYAQQQRWEPALRYARALSELLPGAPEPRALLRRIEAGREAGGTQRSSSEAQGTSR